MIWRTGKRTEAEYFEDRTKAFCLPHLFKVKSCFKLFMVLREFSKVSWLKSSKTMNVFMKDDLPKLSKTFRNVSQSFCDLLFQHSYIFNMLRGSNVT